MNLMLGNLSVSQIEKEYQVEFLQEDKDWLNAHHQDKAEDIEQDKWHCFDLPRTILCGSQNFAKEMFERLCKYDFKGQINIIW